MNNLDNYMSTSKNYILMYALSSTDRIAALSRYLPKLTAGYVQLSKAIRSNPVAHHLFSIADWGAGWPGQPGTEYGIENGKNDGSFKHARETPQNHAADHTQEKNQNRQFTCTRDQHGFHDIINRYHYREGINTHKNSPSCLACSKQPYCHRYKNPNRP